MKTIFRTLMVIVVLAAAGMLFVAYSGAVNVAADSHDPPGLDWFLATTSDHSVERRAAGVVVPDLADEDMVREGGEHYQAMCQGCHGAPGVEVSPVQQGLNPAAPDLAGRDAPDPAEEFWVVKHGIKMTGMPAFGATHDDDEIWEMVAFLQRLKGMSATDYAQFASQQDGGVRGEETEETPGGNEHHEMPGEHD